MNETGVFAHSLLGRGASIIVACRPGLFLVVAHTYPGSLFDLQAAGPGNVDCVILDPHSSRDAVKPIITKQSEDNYLVQYTPKTEGLHSVNVFFAGQQIPNSPFGVMVSPSKYIRPPLYIYLARYLSIDRLIY